jgi:hypothetical protein
VRPIRGETAEPAPTSDPTKYQPKLEAVERSDWPPLFKVLATARTFLQAFDDQPPTFSTERVEEKLEALRKAVDNCAHVDVF